MGLGYEASDSANTKPHFRDNEIDAEVLPELTDGDLEKLGVLLGTGIACSRRSPESGCHGASRERRQVRPRPSTDAPSAARSQ